jgi:hypothetical protein
LLAILISGGWWLRPRTTASDTAATAQRLGTPLPGLAAASSNAGAAATASLTITVSDDHGPLRDAIVRLMPESGDARVLSTGADGVARAARLDPGRWHVSASAAGHVASALPARELTAGSDAQLTMQLAPGGRTLRGTVSDTTGGPVSGALIEAAKLTSAAVPDDAVATAFSARDGTYRMTVAEGSLLVAVSSPDYASQIRRIELGVAGAIANFSLVPGGVIDGVVQDERSREPVAGATVRARNKPGQLSSAERHAVADADGRFRITGLKPGDWQIDAAAPPRYTRDPVHVGLAVAAQVSDVEVQIGPTPVIRGRVVDDTGAPAPAVVVHAVGFGTSTTVTADAAGGFTLQGLRPGGYTLSGESVSFLRAQVTTLWLADKDLEGVVVQVKRGLVLKGHVEPRQPCQVFHEFVLGAGQSESPAPDVSTGPDGEFALRPFDRGSATLVARCPSGDQGERQAQVAPGMSDLVVAVTPGGSLDGRVVDGGGQPVPGVSVVVNAPEAIAALRSGPAGIRFRLTGGLVTSGEQSLTDAAGAFQIHGLPPGTYGLSVVDRGKPRPLRTRSPVITLAASERRTGIELIVESTSGFIAGTVTSPDGAPLADAWVSATPELTTLELMNLDTSHTTSPAMNLGPGGSDPTPPPVLTDARGHYELAGLFHMRYTVTAEAQRGQLRARRVDVIPDVTLDLQTHGVSSITGTVTGPGGPVAVFSVALRGPTRADRSIAQGQFAFDHVEPGDYTVYVESLIGGGTGQITVAPGATATLDIALSVNGTVTGVVVDATGQPAGGMQVVVTRNDDQGSERIRPPVTTGPDGRFRIAHAPGVGRLVVLRPAQRPFVQRGFAIESGQVVDLGLIVIDSPPSARSAPR